MGLATVLRRSSSYTHRARQQLASDRVWWCLLAARHNETSTPTRSAPADRRMHRLAAEAAAGNQPGDHRVRVPHLACEELVASPDRRGHMRHQFKKAPREKR